MSVRTPGYEHTRAACPNVANHTEKPPTGYLDFFDWAHEMNKTHRQERCPDCGYWVIWEKRTPTPRPSSRKAAKAQPAGLPECDGHDDTRGVA